MKRNRTRRGRSLRHSMTLMALTSVATLSLAIGGCVGAPKPSASPYTAPGEVDRSTAKAESLNRAAAERLDTKPAEAEAMLRDALAADLYHGPAHNNLGVLYLKQGKLYEAANEFEWARKLMPGHPDPRFNLALTLERAGRTDEALAMYDTALEVYGEHMPSMQAIARMQVKRGVKDGRTAELLSEIALRGETDRWREWARGRMAVGQSGER